jgi:FixJ family two-component response regulator
VYEARKIIHLHHVSSKLIDLIWAGFTKKKMAYQLKISVKTIEAHPEQYDEENQSLKQGRTVEDGS